MCKEAREYSASSIAALSLTCPFTSAAAVLEVRSSPARYSCTVLIASLTTA